MTHRLRALGVDTFGGWGEEAFMKALAKSDAARHDSGLFERLLSML
jgi:hypothetical protein